MSRPEIVIVAAVAQNRVIGRDNKLPWYLPDDLKRFKKLTFCHPVLMGRKTFDSILARNGKPLPGRRNIVLTSGKRYPGFPEVETYGSFPDAIASLASDEQVSVIGGASVYASALPAADRLELTIVEKAYDGDAYFPEYESLLEEAFELVAVEQHEGFRFETHLARKSREGAK